MNQQRMVFSQIFDLLHREQFQRCVKRYSGDKRVRSFSCRDQFLCMAFAQLTRRESLNDIVTCLCAHSDKLFSMGIRSNIAKSTLADANEQRNWRIYADLAYVLIKKARRLYADEALDFELEETVYALDATTIDLCLSLFPWAHFRTTKAAVKLHTQIDLRGSIPTFIEITPGKVHDVNMLDALVLEPGAYYVLDRGYVDFARLFLFSEAMAYFVIRAKSHLNYIRLRSLKVVHGSGVCSDQVIRFRGFYASKDYPQKFRRIRFYDADNGRHFIYLTNNFTLPALIICQMYKGRWKIELFFKWIKQHLRIKKFFGTSPNAVKTQVWIAISAYVLMAILKKQWQLELSLHRISQVLSLSVFEKVPFYELLTKPDHSSASSDHSNQLTFNYF